MIIGKLDPSAFCFCKFKWTFAGGGQGNAFIYFADIS